MGLARRTAAGPAAGRDRVVTTRCSGGELVWVREGGLAARRAQGAHRLRGFAVFRRIRSSRRLAGRAISCSRLLARLPSGGRSAHVAPVLLVREAWWGIVSWGGRAVTRRYWGAFTCVEADTGFARTSGTKSPRPATLGAVSEACPPSRGSQIRCSHVVEPLTDRYIGIAELRSVVSRVTS